MTRRRGLALIAGTSLWLGGCGGNARNPEPTADATAVPTPTMPPNAALGPVTWSTALTSSGEPDSIVEVFPRDAATIYAAVEATHLVAGESLSATWSINGTPIEGIDTTVTVEDGATAGWVTFSLTWEGEALWPVGTLEVTITASSGATISGAIEIVSNQ